LRTGDITYTGFAETDRDVGIKTDWKRAEDVYVIADFVNGSQAVNFKVLVKPLVNLIWVAGIVFLLGSGVALWPDAREQRRLVTRLAPARG
jgi:cytochrome c biogenesis factor